MTNIMLAVFTCAFFIIVIVLMTGSFLRYLEKDNPVKFEEIWAESERIWNYMYPVRISLLYIVPRTYEFWELSEPAIKLGHRIRAVSLAAIGVFVVALAVVVIELL